MILQWLKTRIQNRGRFFVFSLAFNALAVGLLIQLGNPLLSIYYDDLTNRKIKAPDGVGLEYNAFEIQSDGWSEVLAYRPHGVSPKRVSSDCWVENLNKEIRKHPLNVYKQASAITKYLKQCNEQLYYGRERGIDPTVDYLNLYYPLSESPMVKATTFRLPDGRVITGILGLQKTTKARPLVIVKCGMFCNAAESSNPANAFMHLFDESPFHVFLLSNIASQDFEMLNGGIAIGGFDEGYQIYELAKWLKSESSPLQRRISSIHAMGFSLGSHGILYSGLYSSVNDSKNNPVINSVTAICPVVDLEKSISGLFEGALQGRVAGLITSREMQRVVKRLDMMQEDVLSRWFPDPQEILTEVRKSITSYYTKFTKSGFKYRPFKNQKVDSIDKFWQVNSYTQHAHLVKRPTLLLPADDDAVVLSKVNTSPLKTLLGKKNRHIQVVDMQAGGHCAHSIANGWSLMSGVLRNFIISHSPELKYEQQKMDITKIFEWQKWPYSEELGDYEKYYNVYWKFSKKQDYATIDFDVLNKSVPGCNYDSIKSDSCFRQIRAEMPISSLEKWGFEVPETRLQANQYTRFANTRFQILNKEEVDVRSGNLKPAILSMNKIAD